MYSVKKNKRVSLDMYEQNKKEAERNVIEFIAD